jgi:hypothetical protein
MKNKNIIIIIVFVLLLVVIAISFIFLNKNISIDTNNSSESISLNPDVYPLYGGLSWSNASSTDEYSNLVGYEVSASAAKNISNIAEVSSPFEKYYSEKLESLGWTVDNSLAAGGPGSDITAYKKGSEYIIIRFDTNFKGTKANEPVQCPCDVAFYVFSGEIK